MNKKTDGHLSGLFKMMSNELNKDEIKAKENAMVEQFENFLKAEVVVSKKELPIKEQVLNSKNGVYVEDIKTVEDVLMSIIDTPNDEELEETNTYTPIGTYGDKIKTDDPLTPFNEKNYATLEDLQKHYSMFLSKIQQQLASIGGGGEVNFRYLDDVARETIGDTDQILRYNPTTKKFFFGQLSGDQGPIRSLQFDEDGENVDRIPGMLTWNKAEDCLDIVQKDGSTLQIGLEQYIQVVNNTGGLLDEGTTVQFSGVDGGNLETPIATPMVADADTKPLVMIGVLTNPIENGGIGRATTFGKVRDLDTTGTVVGEEWQVGDILYVHPTMPGNLTRFKPTAPSPVISVCAVLRVDQEVGILLVRPTIWPRLHYANFSSNVTQTALLPNTPYAAKFEITSIASGHTTGTPNSRIIAAYSGFYKYHFTAQLLSTNASAKNVFFWGRKNGVDIPYSTKTLSIVGNAVYSVLSFDFTVSMIENDYFELMWATSDITAAIVAPPQTTFSPTSPSIKMTVTQVAL